jgi:carboxypeptidase D
MCIESLTPGQISVSDPLVLRFLGFDRMLGSVLGFPRSTQEFIYFNRHVKFPVDNVCRVNPSFSQDRCQTKPAFVKISALTIVIQVQDAIHAPHITWNDCSDNAVYINATTGRPGNDQSIPSTLSVLPNVIEKSVRTVIAHGLAVRFININRVCSD